MIGRHVDTGSPTPIGIAAIVTRSSVEDAREILRHVDNQ